MIRFITNFGYRVLTQKNNYRAPSMNGFITNFRCQVFNGSGEEKREQYITFMDIFGGMSAPV